MQYDQNSVNLLVQIVIESMKEVGVTEEQIEKMNEIVPRKFEEATLIMKAGML
jgi:predicted metal-dependent phosphotriesterase family hydrolase